MLPLLIAMTLSAVAQPPTLWEPNSKPQERFLQTGAYEALYGGAAGGGKSDALLVGALRHVDKPRYHALLLRREFPELRRTLIKRSLELYPQTAPGARYRQDEATWYFPSGARIEFGHAQHEQDVHKYQGGEFQYLGFDEVTHFTEYQFRYLLSRGRSAVAADGTSIPINVRATTNPGGPGHAWVMARWAPWLWREPGTPEMPQWAGPRAASGQVLHYTLSEDGTETWVPQGTPESFGRVFIGARASDNPNISPEYILSLRGQDAVTRAQLLDGDWLARPSAGSLFKRAWFELVDEAPKEVLVRVRYWDRAATKPHDGNKDPDWTRGVRLSLDKDGIWYVEHVAGVRDQPHMVKRLVKQTAELDGKRCVVGIEQDPGQAGVAEAHDHARELAGWNVRLFRPTGDKVTRAQPVSAQAGAGNVRIVRGQWNAAFLDELEAFPEGGHDDQVDGLSGAFNAILLLKQPVRTASIRSPISELG